MTPTFKSIALAALSGLLGQFTLPLLLMLVLAEGTGGFLNITGSGMAMILALFMIQGLWLFLPLATFTGYLCVKLTSSTIKACLLSAAANLALLVMLGQILGR